MDIIEQFLSGKTEDKDLCEDAIIVTDDFACILDGFTTKTDQRWEGGKTTGTMAVNLLTQEIGLLPASIRAVDAVKQLDASIKSYYVKHNCAEQMAKSPVNRFTASAVIFSNYHRQIWVIGEGQCIINESYYRVDKYVDALLSDVRAFYLETELRSGKNLADLASHDTGREYITPLLKRQLFFQNSAQKSVYNYDCLDGFYNHKSGFVRVFDLTEPNDFIVIATDGYPKIMSTLKESEAYLKQILQEDPLCFRSFKSTKGLVKGNTSFDDRAYLKIRLEDYTI